MEASPLKYPNHRPLFSFRFKISILFRFENLEIFFKREIRLSHVSHVREEYLPTYLSTFPLTLGLARVASIIALRHETERVAKITELLLEKGFERKVLSFHRHLWRSAMTSPTIDPRLVVTMNSA